MSPSRPLRWNGYCSVKRMTNQGPDTPRPGKEDPHPDSRGTPEPATPTPDPTPLGDGEPIPERPEPTPVDA